MDLSELVDNQPNHDPEMIREPNDLVEGHFYARVSPNGRVSDVFQITQLPSGYSEFFLADVVDSMNAWSLPPGARRRKSFADCCLRSGYGVGKWQGQWFLLELGATSWAEALDETEKYKRI